MANNVFFELNEFQKALKCYDQVISLKKDYLPVYEGKAKIFKLIEKNDDAIKEWNNVIGFEPFNENALSEKGDLLFDNNKQYPSDHQPVSATITLSK